jgi:hypothetical protein
MLGSFEMGGSSVVDRQFDVVEGDIERIAQQIGTPFDVILGWGFFGEYQTVFDFPAGLLTLRRPHPGRTHEPAISDASLETLTLPFTARAGVPVVEGLIGETAVRFVVDTGAPFSTLDRGFASTLPPPSKRETVGYRGQQVPLDVRAVAFGEQRPEVSFLPKDLAALRLTGASGVLGNNLLMQHRVTFDPTRSTITLTR